MTTKTTITLSPIKRCYGSTHLRKRRSLFFLINRKQQMHLSLTIPTIIAVSCEQQIISLRKLPDLIHNAFIEHQRRETIIHIATILRKVGDQVDEQLQVIIVH